jgi:diguanylate cyclase
MDLDHFKDCNDTYGHRAGDLVLQALSGMLIEQTRKQDIVCRFGGEEFLVVLPNTHLSIARQRAEEWRAAFQDLVVAMGDLEIKTTLSAGLACYPLDGDKAEELIKVADDALYKAKQEGRNQVFWL